jgi:hypothetical protein
VRRPALKYADCPATEPRISLEKEKILHLQDRLARRRNESKRRGDGRASVCFGLPQIDKASQELTARAVYKQADRPSEALPSIPFSDVEFLKDIEILRRLPMFPSSGARSTPICSACAEYLLLLCDKPNGNMNQSVCQQHAFAGVDSPFCLLLERPRRGDRARSHRIPASGAQ